MARPVVGVDLRYVAGSSRGYRRMMNLYFELDRIDSEFQFEWITPPTRLTDRFGRSRENPLTSLSKSGTPTLLEDPNKNSDEGAPRSPQTRLVSPSRRLRFLHRPVLGRLRTWFWEMPDILHFPTADCWSVPSCKTVVTLHDLAPLRFPEWFFSGALEERQYQDHLDSIFRVADVVITVSRFSREEIVRHFPGHASKVQLIYQGVAPEFFMEDRDPSQTERFRYNVGAPEGYLLYCGGVDARKNLEFLVDVFARLIEKKFPKKLVIVGDVDHPKKGMGNLRQQVGDRGLGDRVLFPGWISDDLLRRYYNAADLFLFPSKMEGFGYAPLEAMACGCPTLCSNAASIPETVGEASLLLPEDDADAWVQAVQELFSAPERMETLRQEGLRQVQNYDWCKTAMETLEVYRNLRESR